MSRRYTLAELRSRVEPTALTRENTPGSDTRVRRAGAALARDLRGEGVGWTVLRSRQWEHASPAGLILVKPECFSRLGFSTGVTFCDRPNGGEIKLRDGSTITVEPAEDGEGR